MLAHPKLCDDTSPCHPVRSTLLDSTVCQCLHMNIKASVGQWVILDLFFLKLILITSENHFHPPPNFTIIYYALILQLWAPACLTNNTRVLQIKHTWLLLYVCKNSTASLQRIVKSSVFPWAEVLVLIYSFPDKNHLGLGAAVAWLWWQYHFD